MSLSQDYHSPSSTHDANASDDALVADIKVHKSLEALKGAWRELETDGYATPYQTYALMKAWSSTLGQTAGVQVRYVQMLNASNQTVAILPIGLSTSPLGCKAVFLCGKHANFNMMLFSKSAMNMLKGAALQESLEKIARLCGIDCYHFIHQPRQWMGMDNPLLSIPMQASANTAYKADLMPSGDDMIRSLMSSESRKKLRNKQKRIGEFGPVHFQKAKTSEEVERVIQVFLEQKGARFKEQGIENPFDSLEGVEFLRQGCFANGSTNPAISLYFLSAGERIVSVLGGAEHQGRLSGMFISFDSAPEIARLSPGDLLLLHLVRQLCDKGYAVFDLGTGDATYKGDYCQIEEHLFDSILPMTARGEVMAALLRSANRTKRWIKQNPTALKLVRRFR